MLRINSRSISKFVIMYIFSVKEFDGLPIVILGFIVIVNFPHTSLKRMYNTTRKKLQSPMKTKQYPLSERIHYAFDKTLSRGPLVLALWLALVSILFIVIVTLFSQLARLNPALTLLENFWEMLLQALAPNPVDISAGPWPFLLAMLVITLGGIFMVSIFIGITTNAIDDKVQSLRRGLSRVIEQNQTVILGWDEHIFTIISELVIANENQPKSCIVILGEKDKVEMEQEIRERIHGTGRTTVVCRSGRPIDIVDLRLVSLDTAKSIIILSPDGEDPDSCVIKSLLAITNNPLRKSEPYNIVTEIHDVYNLDAARLVGKNEAIVLLIDDIIAHITAQTCRQSGLSVVYTELLNFEGDEIYFQEEPQLVGKTFGESLLLYENSTVIGLRPKNSTPRLNPPMDTLIQPGDKVIAISEDDDTVILSGMHSIPVQSDAIYLRTPAPALPERTLILGWNSQGATIVVELDQYVARGSEITIVTSNASVGADISQIQSRLENQSITFHTGDTASRAVLNSLNVEAYKHIIVLADRYVSSNDIADAHTLVALLHLRDIGDQFGNPYSIVTEMLDVRNRALAQIARPDDFIVSDELASLLMAQISENNELSLVFEELFFAEGSEIYIKPITDYINLGQPINFYTLIEAARGKGEVAIGYRKSEQANDPTNSFGIVVNPDKSNTVIFGEVDRLIVLAES